MNLVTSPHPYHRALPGGFLPRLMPLLIMGLTLLTGCSTEPERGAGFDPLTPAISSLWGKDGELWTPTGNLPDYSYAGYHAGEATLPTPPATADIKKDFGAKGDGSSDDTQAFHDALARGGVIAIPPGQYVIRKRLVISKSGTVLRGAGQGLTTLEFPLSLADVDGVQALKTPQSQYSFYDAFISTNGNEGGTLLASVTANASRGSRNLQVSATTGLSVGQWVTLVETDVNNTLIERLHGDTDYPGTDLTGKPAVNFRSRIAAINDNGTGRSITLERPLPVDVDTRWTPQIRSFTPSLSEVGVEELSVHFPGTIYPGHFLERGYNAFWLKGAAHSWLRNITIWNADVPAVVTRSSFCTLDGITVDTDMNRASRTGFHGHHAIWVSFYSNDVLVTHFNVNKKYIHDLSTEGPSMGTVFETGRGVDLNMDHHRNAPYGTLFSDIDLGAGTRPFDSSGAWFRGAHSAAYTTFWGLRSKSRFDLPLDSPKRPTWSPPSTDKFSFGPRINFFGVNTSERRSPRKDWSVEASGAPNLQPPRLYEAMRIKRTGK